MKGVATPGPGTIKVETLNISGNQMNFSGSSLAGGTTTVFPVGALSVQCGDGVGADPGPCNTEAISPNFETPYIETWTLNVQRSLTNNLSLEVAYVGTHGTRLLGFQDINQPLIGSGVTVAQMLREPDRRANWSKLRGPTMPSSLIWRRLTNCLISTTRVTTACRLL